jgi:transposase
MSTNITACSVGAQLSLGIDIPKDALVNATPVQNGRRLFRPYQVNQLGLFPLEMEALLPEDHLVFFVKDAVARLDLSNILSKYEGKSGFGPYPYNPVMMVTLIVYSYCCGDKSCRKINQMLTENIPCRVIAGNEKPCPDTINSFRQMHLEELGALFQQILEMAVDAGLVPLEKVAIDGSKVKAFASKRKAMSYERMCKRVRELPKAIRELKDKLSKLEDKDDLRSQKERLQLQQEIAFQEKRLSRISIHKKALEKRVKATGSGSGRPEATAQINFTDPESNIMHRSGKTFEQAYNAQIVVDSRAQIIVAQDVVRDNNDKKQLISMLSQTKRNLGQTPRSALADNGYFSEENLQDKAVEMIDLFIPPTKKQQDSGKITTIGRLPANISLADRMRRKLSTKAGREVYKMRKCIVEPVFGQIKSSVLDFASFSFRGLKKVKAEWALACAAHNLLKIFRSGYRFAPSTA